MSDFILFKKLMIDIRPKQNIAILGALLYLPITILNVSQPLIIGKAIERVINLGLRQEIFLWALFLFLVIAFLALLELVQGFILQMVGQNLIKNLRQKAFIKCCKLPISYLEKTPLGKILTHIVNDCESVAEMFSLGAIQVIGDCLFLSGTLIMLFIVDIKLTFYSFFTLPILLIGIYIFRYLTKTAFYKIRAILSSLNEFLQENLSGMSTVQMMSILKLAKKEFEKKNNQYLLASKRAIFLDAAIYSFVDSVSFLAVGFVLFGAHELSLENILKIGALVAFIEALGRFFMPIKEFSNRYTILQSAIVSLQRIYDFLNTPEEDLKIGDKIDGFNEKIEIKNLTFNYRPEEPVLKNISFAINKGDKLAIIGPTGSGKSTIIKLINRFYNIYEGGIFLDGKNINNICLTDLRSLITVVPQEVFLFHGTLKENLCYGKNSSDEEIWQALVAVQMDETIRKTGGLMQKVLYQGINFSLGERQLLAFARALLVKRPILILDEAYANIDKKTSQALAIATLNLMKECTSIIIAHRLSTIENCGRILIFNNGLLIEESRPLLSNKDELYSKWLSLEKAAIGF